MIRSDGFARGTSETSDESHPVGAPQGADSLGWRVHRLFVDLPRFLRFATGVATPISRRTLLGGAVAAAAAVGIGFVTLREAESAAEALPVPAPEPPLSEDDLPQLIKAAQAEGALTLIAMPSTWANYGNIISAFEDEYQIPVTVVSPNATSAQELTALRLMRGQSRLPDVIEVGPAFAAQAVKQGLVVPYKPTAWDKIPDNLRDPDGMWIGTYYGLISFGVNTTKVNDPPTTWSDLNNSQYRGMAATNGDPRQANSALNAVWSSSLANGGSLDDIDPGIQFFGELSKQGIYIPLQANVANLANQQVLISLDWSFNMPGAAAVLKESGIDFSASVPSDGVMGGYYCDAITNGAPHPNAARLWMEWVTSGKGALLYLDGGAIPALYPQFVADGKVPQDVQDQFPDEQTLASLQFPTLDQTATASAEVGANWNSVV
jgi:putative spermidine/putrescine transport system substrate-binding protein